MIILSLSLGGYGANMGIKGLWFSFGVANIYCCSQFIKYIYKLNWEDQAALINIRMEKE